MINPDSASVQFKPEDDNPWLKMASEAVSERAELDNDDFEKREKERRNTGISVDYNGLIHLTQELDGGYRVECSNDNKHLENEINIGLAEITEIKVLEDGRSGVFLGGTPFIYFSPENGETEQINKLTSFEIRLLGQGETIDVPFDRSEKPDFAPRTDLHTHFAGAITSNSLMEIGLQHNIEYPIWLLEKAGIKIDVNSSEQKNISFSELSEDNIEQLKNAMILSPVTQETFLTMEDIYALRGPITKNKELFPDLLKSLANEYKERGIDYTELSFSPLIDDPDYMTMLQENMPQIEEQTGVKIRFLAALWRHSNKEWNEDETDRIKSIARSKYVVGMDVMGHETNSTEDFGDELRTISEYAMTEDPNFTIRVHAGENPIFADNVRKTLDIINSEHNSIQERVGHGVPMPNIRIGHGLYGVDDETIQMAKQMGVIIEFNMSSNLALNNIDSIKDVPIKKYLDHGVDVVLGTDGHGLYSTEGEQETILAMAAGLTRDDFDKIRAAEEKVEARAIAREMSHPDNSDVSELYDFKFSTPDGNQRWNDAVEAKYQQERERLVQILHQRVEETGAISDEAQIIADIDNKTPILISGASAKSFGNISPENQQHIRLTMQTIANIINPDNAYIMTGGTNHGVEKEMHEAVQRRNTGSNQPIICLGGITMEAATEENNILSPNTITHAMLMTVDGRPARDWQELPEAQTSFIQARDGELIAVGGGAIVRDMIQKGHNLGINMHLMDGPEGASTDKSHSLRKNNYGFKTIKELVEDLYMKRPELFRNDFSLDKLDDELTRASREILGEIAA